MANLTKTIKEKEVPTIFCESKVSSEAQRQVAIEQEQVLVEIFM